MTTQPQHHPYTWINSIPNSCRRFSLPPTSSDNTNTSGNSMNSSSSNHSYHSYSSGGTCASSPRSFLRRQLSLSSAGSHHGGYNNSGTATGSQHQQPQMLQPLPLQIPPLQRRMRRFSFPNIGSMMSGSSSNSHGSAPTPPPSLLVYVDPSSEKPLRLRRSLRRCKSCDTSSTSTSSTSSSSYGSPNDRWHSSYVPPSSTDDNHNNSHVRRNNYEWTSSASMSSITNESVEDVAAALGYYGTMSNEDEYADQQKISSNNSSHRPPRMPTRLRRHPSLPDLQTSKRRQQQLQHTCSSTNNNKLSSQVGGPPRMPRRSSIAVVEQAATSSTGGNSRSRLNATFPKRTLSDNNKSKSSPSLKSGIGGGNTNRSTTNNNAIWNATLPKRSSSGPRKCRSMDVELLQPPTATTAINRLNSKRSSTMPTGKVASCDNYGNVDKEEDKEKMDCTTARTLPIARATDPLPRNSRNLNENNSSNNRNTDQKKKAYHPKAPSAA